jgi:dGTPase
MSDKADRFIKQLFDVYIHNTNLLPTDKQSMIKKDTMHTVICDYIAGMTDRFALNEYKKLFQPYEKV